MNIDLNCDFDFIQPEKTIKIIKEVFSSKSKFDNVFFKGDFDLADRDTINFRYVCPFCEKSCFKINLRDRLRDDFEKIVENKILLPEDIEENKIVISSKLFKNSYNMIYGGTPTYSFIKCNNCTSEYLAVIGLDEKQYGLYYGQAQGMWLIKQGRVINDTQQK
ncbi:hypothetical protein [Aquimarina algiphila]|nr:hypothetical protein [Aquimarina algiphila]